MKWFYPIIAAPIYIIFALPLFVLYGLSNFVYVILYDVVGYRKKVVFQNLRNSFPQKTEAELQAIAKRYYKHMVDVIIETLKLSTLSNAELKKRVVFKNTEIITQLQQQNKSYLFVLGHMGNWEWSGQSFSVNNLGPLYGLYHPLASPFFDWLMIKLRTRFELKLIPMQQVLRHMVGYKNTFTGTAFIADQTPSKENAYWVNFLHQDTPVFIGTEKIAKRFNYPVVYASCQKIARGYYQITFILITDNPALHPDGWITEQHTALLEQDIVNQPHIWLWSHRRWKHKRS